MMTVPKRIRTDDSYSLEESLLVLRGLGVQTSSSSSTYLSSATTRFIPTNMIQDIFIHEAFKGFEVRFYLAVVVEGDEEVVVVFPVSRRATRGKKCMGNMLRSTRIYCRIDISWSRSGGEPEHVSTNLSRSRKAQRLDSKWLLPSPNTTFVDATPTSMLRRPSNHAWSISLP